MHRFDLTSAVTGAVCERRSLLLGFLSETCGQFLVVAVSRTGQPPFNVPDPDDDICLRPWWFANQPIKKMSLDFRGENYRYLFFCHGETWKNCPAMSERSTPKKVMFNFLVGERESGKEDAFQTPKLKTKKHQQFCKGYQRICLHSSTVKTGKSEIPSLCKSHWYYGQSHQRSTKILRYCELGIPWHTLDTPNPKCFCTPSNCTMKNSTMKINVQISLPRSGYPTRTQQK